MAVTNYETVNGQILAEYTSGVATEYVHDALGSVIATTDASRTVQNTYRWAGYGTQIAKTGTSSDPRFLWNGAGGYRALGRPHSSHYVRERQYAALEGAWTSSDPLWLLSIAPYAYVRGAPTQITDSSGLLHVKAGTINPGFDGAATQEYAWVLDWWDAVYLYIYGNGGWIIQHVTIDVPDAFCPGAEGTSAVDLCSPLDYWEAWRVQWESVSHMYTFSFGGNATCNNPTAGYGTTDTFIIPPGCPCTQTAGNNIKGVSRLYADKDKNVPPVTSWNQDPSGRPCPGCLYYTTTAPGGWNDGHGEFCHQLHTTYKDCNRRSGPLQCQGPEVPTKASNPPC